MDCVRSAPDIIATLPTIFLPCDECTVRFLDKRAPLPGSKFAEPCSCGKRFIDEVFAHMYVIMREEGDLKPTDPLIAVGSPLLHPGFVMDKPPFLPEKSLVLMSGRVSKRTALRIVKDVREVRGVVKTGNFIPGLANHNLQTLPEVYELLAGCDVRADVYPGPVGPLVVYKQQSLIHVEFPRSGYPKIQSIAKHVGYPPVPLFVDACSGAGTLGLTAACIGVPHVILNDAWYASAFWSAFNLEVNRHYLNLDRVRIFERVEDMEKHPVTREPVKIVETTGNQVIDVYQGDFRLLDQVIPKGSNPVTALDIFEKNHPESVARILHDWQQRIGGDVFIP